MHVIINDREGRDDRIQFSFCYSPLCSFICSNFEVEGNQLMEFHSLASIVFVFVFQF